MTHMSNNVDFEKFFLSLLEELAAREQEVLKKRYQLTGDVAQKNTLKQIGDEYGITRERVRQIEKEAINKLVKLAKADNYLTELQAIKDSLVRYLERRGGLAREDELVSDHLYNDYKLTTLHQNAYLFVLEHMIDEVDQHEAGDDYHSFWILTAVDRQSIFALVNEVINHLVKKSAVQDESSLLSAIKNEILPKVELAHFDPLTGKHTDVTVEDFIRTYLSITKKVEKNILDNWGLAEWADVKPKKLSDKIHLVFKKHEKPLHFRDVAELINTANFDKKNICAATVHNELIANEGYVLIGRGIYAKKDWGYTPGTVTDIISQILKDNSQPMTKEDIYDAVLKQRQVNPSTIYLSLINKNKFNKLSNGLFELK
ncbi:TPA: hypothetical protein DF272_02675 [Candidatus Falkowbacteria bacterium]|nr:hypothetical protein [Candidatus Falkowbacteria bacterium]